MAIVDHAEMDAEELLHGKRSSKAMGVEMLLQSVDFSEVVSDFPDVIILPLPIGIVDMLHEHGLDDLDGREFDPTSILHFEDADGYGLVRGEMEGMVCVENDVEIGGNLFDG